MDFPSATSEPFDLLERAPYSVYDEEEDEAEPASFPSFSSLFIASDEGTALRSRNQIEELGDETDEEADDEDDGETVVWITPRSLPRLHGLEELDDSFQLEVLASQTVSSSGSDEGSSSEEALTRVVNLDHINLTASDDEYGDLSGEEEYNEVDYIDDSSSDLGDVSSEEEDETIIDALFEHEEKLGREFAYPGQDVDISQFDTDYTIEEIVYGLSRPSETYVAVMRLLSKYINLHEAREADGARECLKEIRCTAILAVMDWVYDFPEEPWAVGRARFALVGQLIRLGMALPSCMRDVIEDIKSDLHVEGRMLALSELFRYASPRCATASNIDALEKIVGPVCRERPDNFEMNWAYTKMSNDMTLYVFRNNYLGTEDDPIDREELEEMVASIEKVEEETGLEVYAWF